MLEFIFLLAAFFSVYSYFLYPAVLWLLNRANIACSGDFLEAAVPTSISLIVTAHNESGRIREKIENCLLLKFDGQLELVIASDHSDDGTDDIVREYKDKGVRLVRADKRLGKEYAQLCAIKEVSGEILVFSDVATRIPEDALAKIQAYFSNSAIGAVSSEDRFIGQGGKVVGEGAYVRYEMWLRKMESKLAGLVGLSGSFFAVRKTVCENWDIESPSDFNTALSCSSRGLRAVTAPDVFGYYKDLSDSSKEYKRKVRTALRGMTAIVRHPKVLNPVSHGWFAFQVWSHKVLRWLVPWFLLLLFLSNLFLLPTEIFYQLAFVGQLIFYGVALGAHFHSGFRGNDIAKIVYFFVQVNIALAEASILLIRGNRMTVWKPSAR